MASKSRVKKHFQRLQDLNMKIFGKKASLPCWLVSCNAGRRFFFNKKIPKHQKTCLCQRSPLHPPSLAYGQSKISIFFARTTLHVHLFWYPWPKVGAFRKHCVCTISSARLLLVCFSPQVIELMELMTEEQTRTLQQIIGPPSALLIQTESEHFDVKPF